MKRFINLITVNMANLIKPMIILAVITIVVQVSLYSFNLVTREDYTGNENIMDLADEEETICFKTVEFITETEEILVYTLMLITVMAGIVFTGVNQREKEGKMSVLRMLPEKRITLFAANAIANIFAVVGIYVVNIGCVGVCYLIYSMLVHEKFREAGIDRIDGSSVWGMSWFLIMFVITALVMTVVYSKQAYAYKFKKRGDNNE